MVLGPLRLPLAVLATIALVTVADTAAGEDPGIPAPRLLAPWSTARVTSRRPVFRFEPAPGFTGGVVEICADRACSTVVQRLHAFVGEVAFAEEELPPGVSYWRMRGQAFGVVGAQTSPVWPFTVGVRSTLLSTSYGSSLDLNGDGFDDMVVGNPFDGEITTPALFVYPGGPSGVATSPSVIAPSDGEVYRLGDVNGDGFADLGAAVGGAIGVYFGSPGGVGTTPDVTLTVPPPLVVAVGAGDVNGDGFEDVVATNESNVFVYLGSPSGPQPTASIVLPLPAGVSFVDNLDGLADVNGDGFGDIVAASAFANSEAVIWFGGPSGPQPANSQVIPVPASLGELTIPGGRLNAGDVNGDGFTDLEFIVFSFSAGYRIAVYFGWPFGVFPFPEVIDFPLPSGHGNLTALVGTGDVNGDGFDDVATGTPADVVGVSGNVFVFRGSPFGLGSSPVQVLLGPTGDGNALYAENVAALGDTNGDTLADIATRADLSGSASPLSVFVYLGAPSGFSVSPSVIVTGPPFPESGANYGSAIE
jgi:hypothetical protein